ncbi:MAG: EF-hand domain-containing protein [Burkholderiaceae bacterium]|nr:EF-hand domain-containing protein [Burkholderiaceae bacterium]
MTYQLRKISGFELRSVMLFAALSLGGAAAMAQAPSQTPQAPQATFGGGSAAGVQAAPAPAAAGANDVQAAFDRADTNKDGKLSKKEAEALPAVSSNFAQIDADKNGSLSREEFSKAVQAR